MVTINDENSQEIKSLLDRCRDKDVKKKLISHAKSSGFINNTYRKQAWNIIINKSKYQYSSDDEQIKSQQYYQQIKMDVIRTLKRFPPNYSDSERSELQDELIVMITKILLKHTELHYYQGYHDICLTFLLVLGEELCLPLLDSITMSHLKFFMEPTMEKTRDSLLYLMPLINCVNSECAEYMERSGNGHVIFALPWFITWYSHVLEDLDIILRLYDLFIVSHELMPIYIAAEIVNYYSDEVLSKDCEMSSVHQYLSCLPTEIDLNTWENIIQNALYLFESHPPNTLDELNQDWKIKCHYIEKSPDVEYIRPSFGKNKSKEISKETNRLSCLAYWGVSLAIGGLAIYFWNHSQSINLGDFLNYLY